MRAEPLCVLRKKVTVRDWEWPAPLSQDAAQSDGSSATSSLTFVLLQLPPRLASYFQTVRRGSSEGDH